MLQVLPILYCVCMIGRTDCNRDLGPPQVVVGRRRAPDERAGATRCNRAVAGTVGIAAEA